MKPDEISGLIQRILNNPPYFLHKAFLARFISEMPTLFQIVELVKLNATTTYDLFDNRKHENLTLFAFLSKQYSYMNDLMILADLYKRDKNSLYYSLATASIWSMGAIVSAMYENLLCFAWIADDFSPRSKAFTEFYCVQDLNNYPTNVVLNDGTRIDDAILAGCKQVAGKYKRRNAVFNTDNDYLNRRNYVNEWYNYEKNNLSELSDDIKCKLKYRNTEIEWGKMYKNYQYLCDFKHMSPQKFVVFGFHEEQIKQLGTIFKHGLVAFILCNEIFINVWTALGYEKDQSIINIQNLINELNAR